METHRMIADFRVNSKADMEVKLEAAVTEATQSALLYGNHGVLVTRHDFSRITVTLTPQVPFGLTRENDQANRASATPPGR